MKAFSEQNAEAIAHLYTKDSILLAPNEQPYVGRDGILEFMEIGFQAGLIAIDLKTVEVIGRGDMAHELGIYTLYATVGGENIVAGQGYYQVLWKRERGQWKLHRDIITTSQPPTK
jgi:uncharacterized protein (TIGR02246 family)